MWAWSWSKRPKMLTMAMPEQKILNNDNNETTAARGQHAKAALNFHESGNEATSNQQPATCRLQPTITCNNNNVKSYK